LFWVRRIVVLAPEDRSGPYKPSTYDYKRHDDMRSTEGKPDSRTGRHGSPADWSTIVPEPKITAGGNMAEPTYEELQARVAELEKKTAHRTGELDFKIGEKGGVSVYGLGRFPVTLYYEQWIRLLDTAPKLREFLEENKSKLKLKEK
jgi:hypothetical protein